MSSIHSSPRGRRARAVRVVSAAVSAAAVACAPTVAPAANYFVSPNGSNAGTGAANDPWQTLQFAAGRVAPGDSVTATPGNYAGFHLTTSGTPAARITFNAQPGATINARNPVTPDGINLEQASYVTVDGFNLVGSGNPSTTRAGIRAVGDGFNSANAFSRGVVIQNNTASNWGVWGVFTGFAEGVVIQNNTLSNSAQQHGVYVSNRADAPVIRGNVVFGNAASGIQINADVNTGNTSLPGVDGIVRNAVIEGNVVRGNGGGSAFASPGGAAINLDGVQASAVRNNLLYDNHATGIALFRQDGGGGSSDNAIANNTVINAADARYVLGVSGGSTGNTVFNNILFNLNASSVRGSISITSDSRPGFVSDRNLLDPRFEIAEVARTLAQWRAETGQDLNSAGLTQAQMQALFANYAGNEYRLASNSAALNFGVAGLQNGATFVPAPTTDLLGTTRPQGGGYDAGAYETPVPEPASAAVAGALAGGALLLSRRRRTARTAPLEIKK